MCYYEEHSPITHSTLEASLQGYKLHFRMVSVETRRKRKFFIVCLLPYLWDIRPLIFSALAETQLNQLASLWEIPIAAVIALKGAGDCAEVIKAHLCVLFDT